MKPKAQLLLYSGIMLTITVSAYLGMIPTQLKSIPNYDSAGHFALFGLWGYFFGTAFPKPLLSTNRFILPTGIAFSVMIAIVEELVQQFSTVRTFSGGDLAFGLLGIGCALIVLHIKHK